MSYRVLIPMAGTGSRLGKMTQYLNKSLVGIANRPTLSHVIEQFPLDAEFVIALGYKGNLVREFIELAYPDRKFFFSEVYPFEGTGSGLGLSILSCKKYLQEPFVFISCDTLVREDIPILDQNWMGFAEVLDLQPYRTLELEDGKVLDICEKGKGRLNTHKPYIGLAGIKDYKIFWSAMENGGEDAISMGESYGMRNLLNTGIGAHCFTWFDTGNPEALSHTRDMYSESNAPNILEKANEAIWFVSKNVIKFSDDKQFIANRVTRAKELKGFVPEVTGVTSNMYRYSKSEGKIFSEAVTIPLFDKLLQHSKVFWKFHKLSPKEEKDFHYKCMQFYKDKTLERVELFYKNYNKHDGTEKINGFRMPTLEKLFDSIDWNWLANGLPGRFHGDFHFENILYSHENKHFTFLDWRQDFGGSLTIGDIYYDLAKLLHGLIICHELISKELYCIDWKTNDICFDFNRKQVLVDCEQYFSDWLPANGYEQKKVRILTALVYLNIAALHHYPYSLLLYSLGKFMLNQTLAEK